MKKLMIVDDHHIVREGIKGLIEKHSNYIITHTISSIGEMFLILESSMPDLLLLDLKLADGDGIT
ncbi:response regulator, partial [Methanocalculus natronophilus]|uniref:response regulator n=1 Tax=Methanocalculus natronophilus TaxID=1262400 RepID=UPI0031B5D2B4